MATSFAVFCFALAAIGLVAFWPPESRAIVVWLIVWCSICLATGIAILRRARVAPWLVWTLIAMAALSAADAFMSGMLQGFGIVIDIALFIPLIWFAVWYQKSARASRAGPRF